MPIKNYGTIDMNGSDESARTMVQIFLDQLHAFRSTTNKPDELEWEIDVYKYILGDPAKRLAAYNNARHGDGPHLGIRVSKRKAVEKLGWVIPDQPRKDKT